MEMGGLMNRGIGLLTASLTVLMLSGCLGGAVKYPIECISDYPLKDYIYTKDTWGPLNIDSSRDINPSSNPLTKADFLRDWGEPNEIVTISAEKEMWVYNKSAFCGVVPIYMIPIPLVLPVCNEFDHITFENDQAVHIHFRKISGAVAVIGGGNGFSGPVKCPADYVPSGIDAEILPSSPGITSIPHTEECRHVAYRDGIIWWTDGFEIIKIEPHSFAVIDRISVVDRKHSLLNLSATGFNAVWLRREGRHPDIVSRIDLDTGETVANIPLVHSVDSIATGEGAVWVAHDKLLSRIDPLTNQVAATIELDNIAGPIAVGEGAVWVLHDNLMSRVDPQTNQTTTITIPLSVKVTFPRDAKIMVAGGSVWVAALWDVFRINPQTNQIEDTFNVNLDKKSFSDYYQVLDMSATEETLWVLAFKVSQPKLFERFILQFGLAEFDIKTNTLQSIISLGSSSVGSGDVFTSSSVTAAENAVWVCLPLGIYVVPMAEKTNQHGVP
jgi:hypothetical protein